MQLVNFGKTEWANYINGIAINDVMTAITTETSIYLFKTKEIMKYIDMSSRMEFIDVSGHIELLEYDMPVPERVFKFEMPNKFTYCQSSATFEHFGDCDWMPDGSLLVAAEGPDGPAILRFSTWYADEISSDVVGLCFGSTFSPYLTYTGRICLWNQIEAPWCAYDPKENLVFTSDFDTDVVYGYEPNFNITNTIPSGMIPLKDKLFRVQGGTITEDGTLYLISDEDYNPRIISVDSSGMQKIHIGIARNAFSRPEKIINYFARKNIARDKELQGLASYKGKLYQLLSDKNWFTNDALRMLICNYDK